MELMEDGNLMDKVLILIQRDMEYYNDKQTVLQETICAGVVGGKLDFPRSASFAAVKIVFWWEEEFIAAYRKTSGFLQDDSNTQEKNLTTSGGCGGIVKASDPAKFINLITKSSDELLAHLHVLTQEALDHADLTVLTGTIGAASLLKNCLWCYIQTTSESRTAESDLLVSGQKKYQEMSEALAERLLDLHCRLLSLYIMQDAESLDWENQKPFCESERGSYVVQMWWLYMQGTKEDLWNTVPPKMAQRVFSGMLNESLTIFAVRYSQALPSQHRSHLYIVDISNLLLCIAQLLPSICNNADEFISVDLHSQSKMIRDIHAKCQELLMCLLLRGSPLDILFKVFRKGIDKLELLKPKNNNSASWILFTMPELFPDPSKIDLPPNTKIILELLVLVTQPQPNWTSLLKVLCMENCKLLSKILELTLEEFARFGEDYRTIPNVKSKCGGFLCSGDGTCKGIDYNSKFMGAPHYYDVIYAITFLVLTVGNGKDFQELILKHCTKDPKWFECFDRQRVWNQKRPPWYQSILDLSKDFLEPIAATSINAVQTGASMYQACSIILGCFTQLWECTNKSLTITSSLIQDLLPSNSTPLGKSVLLQFIISALYTELLNTSNDVGLAISEALCGIDEDNKHTEEIEDLLKHAKKCSEDQESEGCKRIEKNPQMIEVLTSDMLFSDEGKRSLKILHHFLKNNSEWFLKEMSGGTNITKAPNILNKEPDKLLHTMFYIGDKPFDQFLVGTWKPNWSAMFDIPMSLSVDRIFKQISSRWEFRDGNFINTPDGHIVQYLNNVMKQNVNESK